MTHDISKYTQASFLQPGKQTKVAVRFSTASGELGSADTAFDLKGFAVKFYTEDGNHDLLGLNFPIFHTRDPILFPDVNHAKKRNPQTNIPDATAIMDLVSERPEMAFFLLYAFSDMSNPKSYRCLKGFGVHAYKMVNSDGEVVFVKFHWTPHQKEEFFTYHEAIQMCANDSNVYVRDLFDNIAMKNYPKWTLSIQVMTFEQSEQHQEDAFDPTKLWKMEEYPLIPIGEMELNENPENFFAQIEQLAFCPSNMVRGIEAGPDPILQARMFAYKDAQLYRLGANFAQIPVNSCPFAQKTYHRDGRMTVGTNGGSAPNYYPNTFNGLNSNDNKSYRQSVYFVSGDVDRVDHIAVDDDFSPVTDHWVNYVGAEEKKRIIESVSETLKLVDRRIQKKFLDNIAFKIHKEFGDGVSAGINL